MELFKLLGTIAIDGSGARGEIDGTVDKAEKAHTKIASAFGKIGSAAVTAGKVIGTGLVAGATAMSGLTMKALDAAGELEQNMGGSEAVFKEHAENMQDTAKKAFSNMGLSASDFLGTANKMGALFQGAGFDIEASSEMSAEAMQRAADVASIMGIDVSSAMEAVAGMAKGNFTMMDNLGVAINDTTLQMFAQEKGLGKLETTQQKVNAAYQLFMEKSAYAAGNYAKENETLAGSLTTAKAAISNFLSGSGTAEELANAIVGAGKVITKKISGILPNLVNGIKELIAQLSPELPGLLQEILPSIIEGAVALFNGLVSALPSLLKILVEQIPFIVSQIAQGLASAFPVLLDTVKELFSQIWGYLSSDEVKGSFRNALVKLFGEDAVATMEGTFQSIKEAMSPLIDAFKNLGGVIGGNAEGSTFFQDAFSVMADVISAVWSNVGQPVFDAITDAINWLSENWTDISDMFCELFEVWWDYVQTVWENIGQPIWDMISYAVESLAELFAKYMPEIKKFFQQAIAGIRDTWENHLKPVFQAIGNYLNNELKPAFEFVFKTIIEPLIKTVFNSISRLWTDTLKPVFDGICDLLLGVFTNDWKTAFQGILNITTGIFNGIQNAIETPMDAAKNIVNDAIEFIKDKFDFEWSLPPLKLPHFTISGSFSLNPLSVPSFGIDWYAKAMDNPMLLTEPTAFGINGKGQIMAGGEAGAEVVSGADTLMNMISEAVASKNARLEEVLMKILAFMMEYMPQMANMQLVMDSGAVVGQLAPGMDEALGRLAAAHGRGN